MAQPKQIKAKAVPNEKDMQDGHRPTVDEIKRIISRSPEAPSSQIGEYLLDRVFRGDSERALSRNRSNVALVDRASRIRGIPDRALRVKKIFRLKRP
jgi:hypothetical protein